MLRRRAKPKMMVKEDEVIRCPGNLKWVRGFECACAKSGGCEGKNEAAHVRIGTDGSMGKKPGDNWAIPLCRRHHAQQHQIGESSFERLYSINMKSIAQELWAKSPHRIRMEKDRAGNGKA